MGHLKEFHLPGAIFLQENMQELVIYSRMQKELTDLQMWMASCDTPCQLWIAQTLFGKAW